MFTQDIHSLTTSSEIIRPDEADEEDRTPARTDRERKAEAVLVDAAAYQQVADNWTQLQPSAKGSWKQSRV